MHQTAIAASHSVALHRLNPFPFLLLVEFHFFELSDRLFWWARSHLMFSGLVQLALVFSHSASVMGRKKQTSRSWRTWASVGGLSGGPGGGIIYVDW